jgi:ribosomal-protein-alanine N-acetyltransferase
MENLDATIKLAAVTLRPIQADDFDVLAGIWSDTEVTRFLPSQGVAIAPERTKETLAAFLEHWEKFGYGVWAIIENRSRRMIGYCGLRYLTDLDETEVLYGLAKEYWGKGIATAVAEAAVQFGFERAGLQRIIALAFPANHASRRVMEKVGLRYKKHVEVFGLRAVYYSVEARKYQKNARSADYLL